MRRLSTNDFVLDAELTNVSSSEYATNVPPATQTPSARAKRIQKDPHGGHNKSSRRTSQVTPPFDATAAPIVPHVNYAWRTLERVKYERYGPGEPILVAPPPGVEGEPQPCHRVALLRTRALDEPREVYRHCAHYVLNDACDFGATCCNIHSVFVATDARLYQKATHYRRHEGKKAVEELSTVCHVGDHALGRDAPAVTPPRYFYHDPYASTEDHRVFVVPPSLQRSPTAAAKRRQPKALRPAPSVPQPPPPSSPPSPT